MGWTSGAEIAESIWAGIVNLIPKDKKPEVAEVILRALEEHDWDCQSEAEFVREYFNHIPGKGYVLKLEYKDLSK